MDSYIGKIPLIVVYLVLAIILPIIAFLTFLQFVNVDNFNKLQRTQEATKDAVNQLLVTPTVKVTPAPTVFTVPTQATQGGVKPATRSGQVR